MTLKSLNSRYVKLIRKTTVIGVGLLVIVSLLGLTRWCAEASGFNRRPAEADNSIPALQGTAAITYLKEHKLYESLMAAHAARTQQGNNSVLAPLFIDEQKLTASDGAEGNFFGASVAISGSTVVVGAWRDTVSANFSQGAAYVFNRQGGSWVETQKLTASDGAVGDNFGWSVAVSDSTVVVGSFGSNFFQGSAYVFNRQGGSWVETQKLTASDGAAGDRFGHSVAVSGSTIVVGSQTDTIGSNFFQGSAYVFNRQGGSWVEEQKLTASDGATGDHFGWSVAISGSTIVVGRALLTIFVEGAAYIFNRQGRSWVETQKLTASDGVGGNIFGWSVTISGSTIVVGAWGDGQTVGVNFDQGAAYVFIRQGGRWVEEQKLTPSDGKPFDEFGWSVAISGSTIVVGSEEEAIGENSAQGSVYVFNHQGGSWVETQKLTAIDAAPQDRFGWSIAVNGSTVVVGSPRSNISQGSAYIYEP